MIRLSPPGFGRIEQAGSLDLHVGGAELNVAAGIARLGINSAFVTALPENPLGRLVSNEIRRAGVDTKHILWQRDGRVGLYFVEFGANPRPSRVVYDREGSAVGRLKGSEIDWKKIFSEYEHFHTTGITPALGTGCLELTRNALATAKKMGLSTSFDLNYRVRLWSEVRAQDSIAPLMGLIDHLITTEEDISRVFKIKGENFESLAKDLVGRFSLQSCAITLREDLSVLRNRWTAVASDGRSVFRDKQYDVEVVDRVGSGDAFCAGYIYGVITGDVGLGVKVGNAMAALKHSVPGDMIVCEKEEIMSLAQGRETSLRIKR
jgi:2-dehydro-3-deoxygluconokinase